MDRFSVKDMFLCLFLFLHPFTALTVGLELDLGEAQSIKRDQYYRSTRQESAEVCARCRSSGACGGVFACRDAAPCLDFLIFFFFFCVSGLFCAAAFGQLACSPSTN